MWLVERVHFIQLETVLTWVREHRWSTRIIHHHWRGETTTATTHGWTGRTGQLIERQGRFLSITASMRNEIIQGDVDFSLGRWPSVLNEQRERTSFIIQRNNRFPLERELDQISRSHTVWWNASWVHPWQAAKKKSTHRYLFICISRGNCCRWAGENSLQWSQRCVFHWS